jgi:hypothetical protein
LLLAVELEVEEDTEDGPAPNLVPLPAKAENVLYKKSKYNVKIINVNFLLLRSL